MKSHSRRSKKQTSKKTGCLTALIICLLIAASFFLWIPGIIATIFFAIKKGPNQKRNLLISGGATLLSFVIFLVIMLTPSTLTGIDAEWDAIAYNVGDTTEVEITPIPSSAKIESLTLSDNNIASLKYKDGKALITFKAEGNEELHFIANNDIASNSKTIEVIDKEAEAERAAAEQTEAERIAAEQAEAERIAAEQAEAERIAAEQAEAERIAAEQAEAERIAAEQATQEQSTKNNFNTYENESQQQTTSSYVLNTSTMKFHFPSCRDVKKIAPQNYSTYDGTRDGIIGQGYSPCGHCNP